MSQRRCCRTIGACLNWQLLAHKPESDHGDDTTIAHVLPGQAQ